MSRGVITRRFGRDVVAECIADAEAYDRHGIATEGGEIAIEPRTGFVVYMGR